MKQSNQNTRRILEGLKNHELQEFRKSWKEAKEIKFVACIHSNNVQNNCNFRSAVIVLLPSKVLKLRSLHKLHMRQWGTAVQIWDWRCLDTCHPSISSLICRGITHNTPKRHNTASHNSKGGWDFLISISNFWSGMVPMVWWFSYKRSIP